MQSRKLVIQQISILFRTTKREKVSKNFPISSLEFEGRKGDG